MAAPTTASMIHPPHVPICSVKVAGYASLVTGVVLVILAICLSAGWTGPGIAYHISAYMAAGAALFALASFAIAACILHVPQAQQDVK